MKGEFFNRIIAYLSLVLFIIPFVFSCSNREKNTTKIDFNIQKLSDSVISEFISNYSIIKLETCTDSKINIIKKVIIQDDKIFVLNHQESKQEILIFSIYGEYLSKISDSSETEFLFSNIEDFDIHPVNGNVTFLDRKDKKLVILGDDNEYIEHYKIDCLATEIEFGINEGKVFTILHGKFPEESSATGSEIYIYDEQFKLLKTYFPYTGNISPVQRSERTLMKRNGAVMFLKSGSNNLYEIGSEDCRIMSDFIFPKPVLPTEKMYDAFYSGKVDLTNYIFNVDYFESDSIIYTTFSGIDGNYIGIYNKETEVSRLFNMLLDPSCKCGIKIDIVGSFRNSFIVQIPRIEIADIIEVLDKERSKCNNEEIFEFIDTMEPGENPILLLIEFNL